MNSDRLQTLVGEFSGKRVLVVGDVAIDHYVRGKVVRLNPESPVPLLDVRAHSEMTGGAGNAAKNAAMLGSTTTLVTVTGNDGAFSRLKELAKGEGYTIVGAADDSRPTIMKTRFLAGSQQLLRVDEEEKHEITGSVEDEVMAAVKNGAAQADAILVSDYAKGVITVRVAEAIMQAASEHSLPVIADLKAAHANWFKGVSAITPNRKEAHEFLKIDFLEDEREPAELAKLLQEKMDSDVFVTLGGDGMYVLPKDGKPVHVKQEHNVEVSDVSGAGDTVAVVLALCYASAVSPQEAAKLANAAGATVVGKLGSVGLTQDELVSMLTHEHK